MHNISILLDENVSSHKFFKRIYNNCNMLTALLNTQGVISEASIALDKAKITNKKINLSIHDPQIDNILVYVFLKTLMTAPEQTRAYKLGLISRKGELLRKPQNQEERDAITNLDLLMFKIRDWLKPKMNYLSRISWLRNTNNNQRFQNMLSNSSSISQQYIIRKINDELGKILQSC